ncbi:MAG TPA: hypothetical protein VF701_17910 [Thermoanaerobaculia bacterium]
MAIRLPLAAIVLLALSLVAFWPRYLSRLGAVDINTHWHAVLGVVWLLLLVVQPLLVRGRRLRDHRIVGRAACGIGVAFVVTGVLLSHRLAAQMDAQEFAQWGYSVYLPLSMTAIFAVALTFAIKWRSVPAIHSRFMACTALPLLDPLLARIAGFYFPPLPAEWLYQVPAFTLCGVVLVGLARSLPRATPGRRDFHVFAIGTAVTLLAFFVTPHSETWFSFVTWFRTLPLT